MTSERASSRRDRPGTVKPPSDFRRAPRRRGEALEAAIREAALAELAERTFDGFSVERVAKRARTGKAAIYRRWATKLELIVDALANGFSDPAPQTSTGDLRRDLLIFHRRLAGALAGPVGGALRANVGKHQEHPQLAEALRARVIAPQERAVLELLAQGSKRGEIPAARSSPELARIGPALVRQQFIESGRPPSAREIESMVDTVLIPLFRGAGSSEPIAASARPRSRPARA